MSVRNRLLLAILVIVTVIGTALPAQATSGDFNSSNIIDDGLFLSTGSMSQTDIQNFLNAQGGFIAKWTDSVDMYTNFTYHNNPSDPASATTTITCLVHQHTNLNAAQIIYQAATNWNPQYVTGKTTQYWTDSNGVSHKEYTSCGTITTDPQPSTPITTVSPKVILTTLQKEQSLDTMPASNDSAYPSTGYSPNSSDYTNATYPSNEYALDWAMGYGVPDSGGKNGVYQGFYMQVMYGAWQLRLNYQCAIGDNSSWPGFEGYSLCWSGMYKVGGTYPIDGTNTTMQNGSTCSLYLYTPHFSGNQSFVTIYERYFGPVHAPVYSWQYAGQTASTDLSKLLPSQTATLTVSATNSGNTTWTNTGSTPVRLGTSHPNDRSSIFAAPSWLGANRPATLDQASVAPGQTGTFTFTIQVPNAPGTYNEYFNLLEEGVTWMNDPGLYFQITINKPTYTWSLSSEGAYTDSSKTTAVDLTKLSPGQTAWLTLGAINTGNVAWTNSGSNPVRLGTSSPQDRSSRYATGAWIGPNRPVTLKEASVAPGATGTFEFPIQVPNGSGTFDEHFDLLVEGLQWMPDIGLMYHTVEQNGYSWSLVSQYAYTDSSKTAGADLSNLSKGQTVFIGFTARNTGTATWYNTGTYPLDLGTSNPRDRNSAFVAAEWLGANRPARLKEASVAPGQIGTFEFNYTAPQTAGTYREYFDPVAEGITWLNDIGLNFYTVVH